MNKRCIYCQQISDVGNDDIDCPKCGLQNKLTPFVSMPMLQASTARPFDAYESPATGKVITNQSQRRYDMKASGCREWEGSEQERKHAAKCKAEEEKKFDEKVESWVGDAYRQLPSEAKQALEQAQI